jgi:inhibitor of cysteine peptidase
MNEREKMKKRTHFWGIVLLSALLLSACQAAPATQQPPTETPGEIKYVYGNTATVESISVLLLESFPLQARAVITGFVPDGCTELDEITVEYQDGTFLLTLTTRKPEGDIVCTEAIVPFEESVPLEIAGLKAGTYKVIAQDQSTEFSLDMDNVLATDEPNAIKFSYGSDARVEEMVVNIMESFPVQVSVNLVGYLPDGCTQIDEITANREGDVFTVEIITKRPSGDIACTMALVPFDVNVALDVEGLPAGEYMVVYDDLSDIFTLESDN